MTQVVVIDYGAGNLLNVVRALEHVGAEVTVTDTSAHIENASKLVLPGVGTFGDCMQALTSRGMLEPIKSYVAKGGLFLGICVGMQVMFDIGEEFGEHQGLGIIAGRCSKIPSVNAAGVAHKIPHTGWSTLLPTNAYPSWNGTIFESLGGLQQPSTYFVHSFMGVPSDNNERLADIDYNGVRICAAVKRGNAYGCQFHPEKSGETGLAILRGFLSKNG